MNAGDLGHVFKMQDKTGGFINVDFRETHAPEVDRYTNCGGLVYFEVFERKDYESDLCFVRKNDVVLDVGANIGAFTAYAGLKGASKIYAFEPEEKNFECLKYNAPPWAKLFPMGIAPEAREYTFFVDENPGGHSFIDGWSSRTGEKRKVQCMSIPSLFKQEKIEKIDFMKMDVEGGEMEIFEALPLEYFHKIGTIVFELHTFMFPRERTINLLKYLEKFYTIKIKRQVGVTGLALIYLSEKMQNA